MKEEKPITKIKLRNLLPSDNLFLIDILNSGSGKLIGEPGIFTQDAFLELRKDFSAEQVIVAEKNLKSYTIGYAAIKNYNIPGRRAELFMFCLSGKGDQSIPDKVTLSAILDWSFGVLGLNKVSIDILDGNKVLSIFEESGFVSEGIRKGQYRIGKNIVDSTFMSCVLGNRQK